jgi:LacI family transcriptional regulator
MQKRVSLKDIAERVGVSSALVSYVMNGKEKEKRVGAEVVKKIRQAAEELNYQPNQIARSLRMKSTRTIGLIVADISNPFFAHLARIIENEAVKSGYTMLFGSSDEDHLRSEALVHSLINRQVDGFIIVPTEGTESQINSLIKRRIPFVLVDRYFPELAASHVVLNNFQATQEATQHLIGKGYTKISLVAYRSTLNHMKERIRGYTEAMREAGLSQLIRVEEVGFDSTDRDMNRICSKIDLAAEERKAFVFATNALSINGLYCMRKRCIRIPSDIGFMGFDGGDCFDLYNPPLSYVEQPLEEMGRLAFRVLLEKLNGSSMVSQIMLSPRMVIRDGECP